MEATKVGFTIALLQGEPPAWDHQLLQQISPSTYTLDGFFSAIVTLYNDPRRAFTAEAAIEALRQGCRPAKDYISEFRRWSADTGWNNVTLHFQFHLGVSVPFKDELAHVGVPETLEELFALVIQIA